MKTYLVTYLFGKSIKDFRIVSQEMEIVNVETAPELRVMLETQPKWKDTIILSIYDLEEEEKKYYNAETNSLVAKEVVEYWAGVEIPRKLPTWEDTFRKWYYQDEEPQQNSGHTIEYDEAGWIQDEEGNTNPDHDRLNAPQNPPEDDEENYEDGDDWKRLIK